MKIRLLALLTLSVIVLPLAGGCGNANLGTPRDLGQVDFDRAFVASRAIVTNYCSIELEEAETGLIQCRPEMVDEPADRLLGSSPARRLTTVQLRRSDQGVTAYVQVIVQRQSLTTQRQIEMGNTYSGAPNQTPSETTGATTFEQNQAWQTVRNDHSMENAILSDIYNAVHFEPATQPAPATAPG